MADVPTTDDRFLDGRLLITQPAKGHRLGTDALLLAAASPAVGRVADVGAGAGLVGLALRLRGARECVLIERDPIFAACADANVARAGLGDISVARADVFRRRDFQADPRLADQSFDAVATNPPYDQSIRSRRTPAPLKLAAHAMDGGTLADWLKACTRLLREGGKLTLIHRADRLADVLAALPNRAGGLRIRPVHPASGEPATRILVQATAGSRAPLAILPGFALHGSDGAFTAEAAAVNRGEAAIQT
ncbi:MAG: tRNA1(Val) (adenine(37)-N6)-methyltransferase [Beijerinckiaceae bacterium]